MATVSELYTIAAMRMDDAARHLARTGVTLSHNDASAIGPDRIAWLRNDLGLVMTSDERGVHFTPRSRVYAGPVCFVADAPGRYGASDGRVWSSHRSIEEGQQALARSPGCALHHGSLEPGTHWTASMESVYPEIQAGQLQLAREMDAIRAELAQERRR